MGTPKKPVKKTSSKSAGAKKTTDDTEDLKPKKRVADDEDEDEDFDMPLDELGSYDNFESYDEDDDF